MTIRWVILLLKNKTTTMMEMIITILKIIKKTQLKLQPLTPIVR